VTDETTVDSEGAPRTGTEVDESTRSGDRDDAFGDWVGETVAAMGRADTARIDLYVRSMLPPPGAKESQRAVVERLTEFESDSTVREVTVNVWGERLCLCDGCRDSYTGRTAIETVEAFLTWGEEREATVTPCFERTSRSSSLTGNSYEGVVPPRVTAVLLVDGVVHGVFPCWFAGDYYSVHDFCAVLEGATDADSPLAASDNTA
jgi:hypothetical protein